MHKNKLNIILILLPVIFLNSFCNKLDVGSPSTSISETNAYNSDATAISVLTGIYSSISSGSFLIGQSIASISFYAGLSADEFTLYDLNNTSRVAYYKNMHTVNPTTGNEFWNNIYPKVFIANSAIEGLTKTNTLNPMVKNQLLGEAKFIRAFFYFYLVNLYGDVPLALTTDWETNSQLKRSSKEEVYQQIIADLNEAKDLLSNNFLDGSLQKITSERIRPTKWVALSLLARVYLYINDWTNAEIQATEVINNTTLFSLPSLNNVFLKNSNEAIWQLQPVNIGWNTEDARIFILPTTGPFTNYPVYLNNKLLNCFEASDQRDSIWINNVTVNGITYYYPYKYKSATRNSSVTEYVMAFRLAEQYLIRAEARAQQNNIIGSQSDLNAVRKRANLQNTKAGDKSTLLTAIFNENQVELFTEWGHRWLDLKRTGKIEIVMPAACIDKGGTWSSYKSLYPIPLTELQRAPQLEQNLGY